MLSLRERNRNRHIFLERFHHSYSKLRSRSLCIFGNVLDARHSQPWETILKSGNKENAQRHVQGQPRGNNFFESREVLYLKRSSGLSSWGGISRLPIRPKKQQAEDELRQIDTLSIIFPRVSWRYAWVTLFTEKVTHNSTSVSPAPLPPFSFPVVAFLYCLPSASRSIFIEASLRRNTLPTFRLAETLSVFPTKTSRHLKHGAVCQVTVLLVEAGVSQFYICILCSVLLLPLQFFATICRLDSE